MSKMSLTNLITGRQQKPLRLVVYGVEGVGKSSFAAASPAPIFLNAEDGTAHLDVARFPQPDNFNEMLEAIGTLYTEQHAFETLVLDSADWAEQIVRSHVCEINKVSSIESMGYGKGWVIVGEQFRKLLQGFDALYGQGMNIIIIAHAQVKPHNDPMLESSYDRYIMKLEKRNEAMLKEWCDVMLFTNFDTSIVQKDDLGAKTKGKSFGKRLIYTTRSAAYDAKNRYNLPERLPLDWPTFWQHYQTFNNPQPTEKTGA